MALTPLNPCIAGNLVFSEGDQVLRWMAGEYIIFAVVGVGAVMLLMLVHPLATVLMMGAVASVTLFLFGEMWILGIRFNQVRKA